MKQISEQTRIVRIPTLVAISDAATNLDPTGMLLDKQTQMIATVNEEDFISLQKKIGNEEAACQYIEMICGKPLLNSSHAELRESFMSSPTLQKVKFKYFDNSWTENSWQKMSNDIASGVLKYGSLFNEIPAVFWTKNTSKQDPFSNAYDDLNRMLKENNLDSIISRFARIEYESLRGVSVTSSLLSRFDEFIERNFDAPEIHVWIQGKYMENKIEYPPSKVIGILSAKVGEIYHQEMPPSIIDLTLADDVAKWSEIWNTSIKQIHIGIMKARHNYISYWYGESRIPITTDAKIIKPRACIPFRVSKYNTMERNTEDYAQMYPQTGIRKLLVGNALRDYLILIDNAIEIMSEIKFTNYSKHVMIGHAQINEEYDFVYKMIGPGEFKMTRWNGINKNTLRYLDGDKLVNFPTTPKFWETKIYSPYRSEDDMNETFMNVFKDEMKKGDTVILFNGGRNFAEKYKHIIMGYVSIDEDTLKRNIKNRINRGNKLNQPVELADILAVTQQYKDLKFKKYKTFDQIKLPGLYMATSGSGKSFFVDTIDQTNNSALKENMYVITNPDFMMGTGSVITTHHRVYALARDEYSLIRQYESKLRDNVSTSGHMISAQLAYTTHTLWYLHEVLYNARMKKSVYMFPVNEPTEDVYHSKAEYFKAFNELDLTYDERSRSQLSSRLKTLNLKISRLIISQLV